MTGICFGLWALLAAPSLRRSAEASPLGVRRTAALAVLSPLARISAFVGLDRVQRETDIALGRHHEPPSAPVVVPDQAPAPLPSPPPPAGPEPAAGPLGPSPRPAPSTAPSIPSPGEVTGGTPLPPPSPDDRMRVLVVGDSIGADLGIGLGRVLGDRGTFVTKVDARESTGLARPDYFDWQSQVPLDVRRFRPDVVVAMFGANDAQGFIIGDHGVALGTPEWRTAYARRVGRLMDAVEASGRPMVWVGMPPMKSSELASTMRMLNGIYRTEAARRSSVAYVDAWSLFSGPNGHYSAFLADASGQEQLARQPDGVHLTADGDVRLAGLVFQVIRALWQPVPEPAPSPAPGPTSATTATPPAQKAGRVAG